MFLNVILCCYGLSGVATEPVEPTVASHRRFSQLWSACQLTSRLSCSASLFCYLQSLAKSLVGRRCTFRSVVRQHRWQWFHLLQHMLLLHGDGLRCHFTVTLGWPNWHYTTQILRYLSGKGRFGIVIQWMVYDGIVVTYSAVMTFIVKLLLPLFCLLLIFSHLYILVRNFVLCVYCCGCC